MDRSVGQAGNRSAVPVRTCSSPQMPVKHQRITMPSFPMTVSSI
jgi:hypothetical protein